MMKTLKILAVNDVKIYPYVLQWDAKKRNLPLTFEAVYNGQEAVEKIKEGNTYDAILMNIEMPCMDGITATEEIRKLGYTKPILAWTCHPRRYRWEMCREAGMDEYIQIKLGDILEEVMVGLVMAKIIDL